MWPAWRKKLWEARTAVQEGRWDEARELLGRDSLRGFLPVKQLSADLAKRYLDRCRERLEQGEWAESLRDAEQASQLGAPGVELEQLRRRQAEQGFADVRNQLMRGDSAAATRQIKRMERHRLGGDRRAAWQQVTELIERARRHADTGEMSEAEALLGRAARSVPDPTDELVVELASQREALRERQRQIKLQEGELHSALSAERWTEVLRVAESVLESAPRHVAAKRARAAAWRAVGVDATRPGPRPKAHFSTRGPRQAVTDDTVDSMPGAGRRMVAWIDSVGAYLLCCEDEVVLGQPNQRGGGGIGILGDISRRHASIRREGENYVLKPLHAVSVDGRRIAGPTLLKHGSLIELGSSVRLRFQRPHALSASAVLTIESHHKTDPAVDGVVLMAESCVLGPKSTSHVVCRGWGSDLVLFRRGERVFCRGGEGLLADGGLIDREAEIAGGMRIEGEDFSLSIEELSAG